MILTVHYFRVVRGVSHGWFQWGKAIFGVLNKRSSITLLSMDPVIVNTVRVKLFFSPPCIISFLIPFNNRKKKNFRFH